MSLDSTNTRPEMIALLGRIAGGEPLSADLQRESARILTSLLRQPPIQMSDSRLPGASHLVAAGLGGSAAGADAIGNRRLIYVHGICKHSPGFSDPWWHALHPFVPSDFGDGNLGQTRLEVVWSDIVNIASAMMASASANAGAGFGVAVPTAEAARRQTAAEIKEALRDRADQHVLNAAVRVDGIGGPPMAAAETASLISIPGVNCIDDFSIYLIDDGVRQRILDRFINVVRPELQAAHEVDIISHSWGTVVAYEGLRQLEDQGLTAPAVRNFFTVGAALSIGPVKMRLREANKDGNKPSNVRRWVNLDAHGDIVGGPLKGRPYSVDFDFVNLDATGCSSFLGLVNPGCAHSSYFDDDNDEVNRDIFARYIDLA